MDRSVAHKNQGIALFYLETIFIDLLSLNLPNILRDLHPFPIPDKDTARIVIFHQIGVPIVINL